MSQKYCTSCGAYITENGRFCTECGAPLLSKSENNAIETQTAPTPIGYGIGQPWNTPVKMGELSPADPTLTMLAEYCIKTVATVGGDGYTEWVLNQCADNSLQLDYYRNYMGYEKEIHETYPAPADTWERIVAIKEQYNLQNPPATRNSGMCGGETLIKIREGDKVIRLVRGMLSDEENAAFSQIQSILVNLASK